MNNETRTDVDIQIDAAISAKNYSQSMADELTRINRDVDDLLLSWTGGAAKAYRDSWEELKEAVSVIVEDLEAIGNSVGSAAHVYSGTDADNSAPFTKLRL